MKGLFALKLDDIHISCDTGIATVPGINPGPWIGKGEPICLTSKLLS